MLLFFSLLHGKQFSNLAILDLSPTIEMVGRRGGSECTCCDYNCGLQKKSKEIRRPGGEIISMKKMSVLNGSLRASSLEDEESFRQLTMNINYVLMIINMYIRKYIHKY